MEREMGINKAAIEITAAVKTVMDPLSAPQDRILANQKCEEFKSSSLAVPCGLLLSSNENNDIIRHYGLQLIEHNIKFNWNVMNPGEKVFLKNNVLEILISQMKDILVEPPYIKYVLCRIIVEMIKREWPQQWPNMMQEFHEICTKGDVQLEMVLLIFLHLAEDVALFHSVPTRRRKDLYQALTANLSNLFTFFLQTLDDHYHQYLKYKELPGEEEKQKAAVHCQLSVMVLKTFGGFVEWIPWSHITEKNFMLLNILCKLLNDPAVRLAAVESLLLIVSRKGKVEERSPLLELFSVDTMNAFLSSANSATSSAVNEENYLFLKRLCEVLVNLGNQLATLWTDANHSLEPKTLEIYLHVILTFTNHPSLVLSELTVSLWICYFQHPILSSNEHVSTVVLGVATSIFRKLMKVRSLSCGGVPASEFNHLDFDSDDEVVAFYLKFRSEAIPILKHAANLQPNAIFHFGAKALLESLESYANGVKDPIFSDYLDSIATYLDTVCSSLYAKNKLELCEEGTKLLKYILEFQIQDPSALSSLLSCISAMFVFLTLSPELMPSLLNRLFHSAFLQFPNDSSDTARKKEESNVGRHASACIVKICKEHPRLLLPSFEEMYNLFKKGDVGLRNQLISEKGCILESLVLISNEFHNFEKQSAFLGEVLYQTKESWEKCVQCMDSTEHFIDAVGLIVSPMQKDLAEMKSSYRFQISNCITLVSGVIRRSKWPADRDLAEKGNFVVQGVGNAANPHFRNPASNHVLPLLNGIFSFIRCVNSLYVPSVHSTFHEDYRSVLEIPDAEKRSLMGISEKPDGCEEKPPPSLPMWMKIFLFHQYEACLIMLGNAAQSFLHEFYGLPGLSQNITNFVFTFMDHLPDFRLRMILHYFFISFLQYCPPDFSHVALNVLETVAPLMFQRLSYQWNKIQTLNLSNVDYDASSEETQEILEDRLCRIITREYIDSLLVGMRGSKWISTTSNEIEEDAKKTANEKLSVLGLLMLQNQIIRPNIVCTFSEGLHWPDTVISNRVAIFCPMVFKALIEDRHIGESEAIYLFRNVCAGLSVLGEHDVNQNSLLSFGLLIYETVRPTCENIFNAVMRFCGCPASQLMKFDSLLFENNGSPAPEKKKKDAFKTVLAEIIGTNIGQLYKNPVKIKNLPPLLKSLKFSASCKGDSYDGLCSLFTVQKDAVHEKNQT